MNRLSVAKRAAILNTLCEGTSMRATSRLQDVSINTVSKLLADAGAFCAAFHDEMVRNVKAERIQADEIWSFCYAKERAIKHDPSIKERNENAGDVWTWTAIDADTKLVISFLVGPRTPPMAYEIMKDLASRVTGRPQLTTDGLKWYADAVDHAFGIDVDYAQLRKTFQSNESGRYSPAQLVSIEKAVINGDPDDRHVSTSYVERANLTMRMSMRRFTRLTNAFSKKFENHVHMISLYTVWYNWVRVHLTTRVTPAMASNLTDRVWDFTEIVKLMDQVNAPTKG